jgi:hypothetical protein
MRVNIIPGSRTIAVDGVSVHITPAYPFPETDPTIEVILWDGFSLHGTDQTRSGTTPFNDPARVGPYIAAFHEEMERRLARQLESYQTMKTATLERHRIELEIRKALDEQQAAAVAQQAQAEAEVAQTGGS